MKLKIAIVLSLIVAAFFSGVACRHAVVTPASASATVAASQPLYYICPMHPAIKYPSPGNCPICGMKLIPVYTNDSNAQAPAPMSCCGAPETTNNP